MKVAGILSLLAALTVVFAACNIDVEDDTYTVIYDANGANGAAPEAQTVNAGSWIALHGVGELSRTGFTFDGWNTLADGTGIPYDAGHHYTVTGDIIMYAQWQRNNVIGINVGSIGITK